MYSMKNTRKTECSDCSYILDFPRGLRRGKGLCRDDIKTPGLLPRTSFETAAMASVAIEAGSNSSSDFPSSISSVDLFTLSGGVGDEGVASSDLWTRWGDGGSAGRVKLRVVPLSAAIVEWVSSGRRRTGTSMSATSAISLESSMSLSPSVSSSVPLYE